MTAHRLTLLERLTERRTDVAVWLVGATALFAGCLIIDSWAVLLVAAGLALMNTARAEGTYHWQRRS